MQDVPSVFGSRVHRWQQQWIIFTYLSFSSKNENKRCSFLKALKLRTSGMQSLIHGVWWLRLNKCISAKHCYCLSDCAICFCPCPSVCQSVSVCTPVRNYSPALLYRSEFKLCSRIPWRPSKFSHRPVIASPGGLFLLNAVAYSYRFCPNIMQIGTHHLYRLGWIACHEP